MRRATALVLMILAVFLLFGASGTDQARAQTTGPNGSEKIAPQLRDALASHRPGEMITAVVTLRTQAELPRDGRDRVARLQGVIQALQATADAAQQPVRTLLAERQAAGLVASVTYFWIFNGLSITAAPEVIQELAARADVLTLTPDEIDIVPATRLTAAQAEQNLAVINVPALWDQGWRGQGIIVANMDSGVSGSHPDLAARWRGGSNSWFDPYGQHPSTPTDLSGHGTWTMGLMVGGDASGTAVGVAPDARWIAVKIFNDRGSATATAIHQGFQWLLDPDGNPGTPDAPHVVNNSWSYGGPGCNLEFQLDLRSLRSAGILPVFAAGNYGPNGLTSVSPANNPEAFAVGAIDDGGAMYSYSSRGPSACGETQTIYPELVAPGVDVKTTDLYGMYTSATGTSAAAPHVAGTLALLLSAAPDLTADQQVTALLNSAVDFGAAGPDNAFGYGRLDALAAYQSLQGGAATPLPTAPATHTPTATAMPTATATAQVTATPTAAPTAVPTATPTALPTATPIASSTPTATTAPAPNMHIGDLDRSATTAGTTWTATVTIEAHAADHTVLSGVTVTGSWSGGYSGSRSCTTDGTGRCQVATGNIARRSTSVTFTVTGATKTGTVYQPSANHDPDGDSTGTAITINRS